MLQYTYGKQSLNEEDYQAVLEVLHSDFLTCGPKVKEFENALCAYTGAKYCVTVANATAGLHIAMLALDISQYDEVITSPITFLSSANCIRFVGANVIFADIESETANIDVKEIEKKITPNTKAIIPVHFAGQSCDMEKIHALAQKHKLYVIEDSAHAIGSNYKNTKVGSCQFSDLSIFSFHPVKNMTTGEGGAITTNNYELYQKLLAYRSHGMHKNHAMQNTWEYEMHELGYNYRLTDIQASLGISQLKKLENFKARRREIVDFYNNNLKLPHLIEKEYSHACFHLYPILVKNRKEFYFKAKEKGLNLQVHYIPIHLQPYYQKLGYKKGEFPKAEAYYEQCISLPLYPTLTDNDLNCIIQTIHEILQ